MSEHNDPHAYHRGRIDGLNSALRHIKSAQASRWPRRSIGLFEIALSVSLLLVVATACFVLVRLVLA